ncbi:MAG: sulfatase-like hydrolase/transferase [Rhodospirillales bacterium]
MVVSALLCLFSHAGAAGAGTRPNIVLIVADDLGYGDLSSYGGTVATPNIDALATAGMRFTDFHASGPVCTPTRAALMTGRYPQRAQLTEALSASATTGLDPNQITISSVLKKAGYRTGLVGKWHLGHLAQFIPSRHSFDFFYGFRKGEIDYVNHLDSLGELDWWRNTAPENVNVYSTTAITREAVGFIQRNVQRPFFLFVSYQAPHVPYQALGSPPIRIPGQPKAASEGNPADYPAMVQAMDSGVGTVINALRTAHLEDNTLVFFLSDNGAFAPGTNYPLRGVKGGLYEGGHRVPAIAYWHGRIAPGVNRDTVATIDLLPTIMEVTAATTLAGHRLDGRSFLPLLFGQAAFLPSRQLFWMYQGNTAARDGSWKLTQIKGATSLFDLDGNLGETTNLAQAYPDTVASLRAATERWKADVNAKPPVTVSMTATANGTTAPATISFSAEAASAEAIVRVEFWGDGKILSSDLTSPYSFDWQAVPAGTHTMRAKAFNVQGTVATSKPATIVLTPPPAGQRTASLSLR